MFYYFGYGSNLSVISLAAKGVTPLRSEPAILQGYRLTFNVPDFFFIEGGTGNITHSPGDAVHGVLHACRDADLASLDRLEALGVCYEREEKSVITYSGRRRRAYIYVGIRSILVGDGEENRPSARYRNILVKGAESAALDRGYIEWLRYLPTVPQRPRPPFVPPVNDAPTFSLKDLAEQPLFTALAGHVFDMSEARPWHAYLRRLLGGKDVSLLFLKRMDSSDGSESFEDVREARLSEEQRRHLNEYLHEFDREYRYVGRVVYEELSPSSSALILGGERKKPASSRHMRSFSPYPERRLGISARAVLKKADFLAAELGHENQGFLSDDAGFMPRERPLLRMPSGFEAWDQIAAELPSLYRRLGVRSAVHALPLLDASKDSLPDHALLRGAVLMGMLSHAYWYVEARPPTDLPEVLSKPWAEIRRRLGRGPRVLSYADLIVYNHRVLNPDLRDPLQISNMRLLVPTVDTDEERIFYLTQTEILARVGPAVGAVVRAQEAVLEDDQEGLECELITILSCLERVVRESLLHINPSPSGATYVDPVVWAKAVAPFAVPIDAGVQGPSGTSSPIFNTLDIFFGRKSFETFLGKEIRALRDTYPPLWREFLAAIGEVNVPAYIQRRGSSRLKGLLGEAVSTYAGPNGFLGRHRMKVYGYLELAFKVGRSVTIGGFQGVFRDRTWDQVDSELEKSRLERAESLPSSCHHVRVKRIYPERPDPSDEVSHVVLDIGGTGVVYEPGDRCGVLPENGPELVERTLAALGADGDERVMLTDEWLDALRLRPGFNNPTPTLSLRNTLRFARIRPVLPRVAEALHALSQNDTLREAIVQRTIDRWELWDLVEMLRHGGFDPRRLYRPQPNSSNDVFCRIVPPEGFRMYSISSAMRLADAGAAEELKLTVGRLRYETRIAGGALTIERSGTASAFLSRAASLGTPISIVIQHPPRFGLPSNPKTPVVMLAGGTGIAPFRSFIAQRLADSDPSEAWLFLGLRSREQMVYGDELRPALASGMLKLRVAFSRDDAELVVDPDGRTRVVDAPGRRRHLGDVLSEEGTARALWELLSRPDIGGARAHVYICGRSGFARSAIDALKEVFRRFAGGSPLERARAADALLCELMAEGRLMEEIFSGHTDDTSLPLIDISTLARHNDEVHGHWLAIDGKVYDVSEFVRLHPGGARVLLGYTGMDATEGYARVHTGHSEIDAMREMYVVGRLRRPELGALSVTLPGPSGPRVVSLWAAHRIWVKALQLVVEMQNALANDHSLQSAVTARGDPATPRSPFKLQRAAETHERFLRSYLDLLVAESIPNLWTVTQGFFAPSDDDALVRNLLERIADSEERAFTEALVEEIMARVATLSTEGEAPAEVAQLTAVCEIIEREDGRLLADLKLQLIEGVALFERYGKETPALGAEALVARCKALVAVVQGYYQRMYEALPKFSAVVEQAPVSRVVSALPTTRTLLATEHWVLEEDMHDEVVILRRTPVSFGSIEDVLASNAAVMSEMVERHAKYGMVVDMRQAPPRNDPAFESAMGDLRRHIATHFARLAVLLDSPVGVLQVQRIGHTDGSMPFATLSEAAAVRFARGQG